jgi:UDP-glucose:(heptosyl)LPS alpha-1,3-glucosyltransferase
MRLVFIKKRFSFYGGAERYLQTLIINFKKAGHEIHVFANKWSKEEGVIFHKINILSLGSFLSTITFNRNVKKTLKKKVGPDCVISFERTTCQDIYRAGDGCHAEWLEIRSKTEPFYKRLSFKINPLHIALLNLEKRLFSNTGLIVTNSRMVKEQIIRHYAVSDEKIAIIYNGVDLRRFTPENRDSSRDTLRKSLGISKDSKILLFVGSGFERKGLKTLIDSIPLLKKDDFKVMVIGKGNVKRYKTLAERRGISEKIIFLKPQKKIEKFYAAADMFILPTLYDPFSNATLEAMASGLPVITTKNNGVTEFIENGYEGFVLNDIFDPQELADKIYLTLGNLKIMGEKAREKAEDFPIERAAIEFIKAIEQVTDTKNLDRRNRLNDF